MQSIWERGVFGGGGGGGWVLFGHSSVVLSCLPPKQPRGEHKPHNLNSQSLSNRRFLAAQNNPAQ